MPAAPDRRPIAQRARAALRNSLARAVFIHRLGEIRDRTYENQQHRASGLNLLVTAIILWNTRYLERAVAALRQTEDVPDQLLAHLSPLGWEHVNLTGDYIWRPSDRSRNAVTDSARSGLRPIPLPRPPEFNGFVRLCVKSGRFVTSGLPTGVRINYWGTGDPWSRPRIQALDRRASRASFSIRLASRGRGAKRAMSPV
jgi:hypothetical protein